MGAMTQTTTPPGAAPFVLDRRTVLHVAPDQSLSTVSVDEETWTRADAVAELRGGRIVAVFDYRSSWTRWERHPVGDELVLVLAGAAVFHLGHAAGDRTVELGAGDCLLVPPMVWHRAEVTGPTSMLFVTPTPARTEHRDA
jgi:mannose-6-phosphate isomerase-like protein (cupin superfamily)